MTTQAEGIKKIEAAISTINCELALLGIKSEYITCARESNKITRSSIKKLRESLNR